MKEINKAIKMLMFVILAFFTMSSSINAQEIDEQMIEESTLKEKYSLKETTYLENNRERIKNIDELLILVNKNRNLPSNYVPKDLIMVKVPFPFKGNHPKKKMRKDAALALEELFQAAKNEGIEIYGLSGYRPYETQKAIFNYKIRTIGEEATRRISAYPGQSEHQTGLAMDVTSKSVRFGLVESFEDTKEGKWIKENSYKNGFIIRYPKGKEHVTGYSYEPWHLRYVGKEAAEYIFSRNTTLEEFFNEVEENENILVIENNQEEFMNNQEELIESQEELMRNIQKVQLLFFTIPF